MEEAEDALELDVALALLAESEVLLSWLLPDESDDGTSEELGDSAGLEALGVGDEASLPQPARVNAANALKIRIDLRFFISNPF